MLRSVRARLILAFLLVVAVAVGIAELVAERTASREFGSYVSRTDTVYLETLAQNLGDYYTASGSWEDVQSVFAALPGMPGHLLLQDTSGEVVADSAPGRGPMGPGPGGPSDGGGDGSSGQGRGVGDDGGGQMGGQGQQGAMPNGQLPATEGEAPAENTPAEGTPTPSATRSIPVYADGQQVATLIVVSSERAAAPADESGDRFLDRVRLALLVGGVAALVVALILAVVLVGGITRPLRRLSQAARRIAAGDLSQRVDVTSPLEAEELAVSFNRMAETLERDQETRRRLLADIVHELRSPLSVIQGTAQGFLDGVISADEAHAAVIRDEAALLSKLITDLRDLALAEAGELRLEMEPIDLGELITQAVAAVLPRAQEKGISVEADSQPGLPRCLVDRDRTLQIMGNLLDNALRHTPQEGRISVRLQKAREGVVALEIADTGEGIAPEHLPHIFERFYRVDAARARGGGTGLGLAIVKQLAEAQGGSAGVESAPGRGSLFTVTFPVATAGADVPPREAD